MAKKNFERYPEQNIIKLYRSNDLSKPISDVYSKEKDLYLLLTSEIAISSTSTFGPLMNVQDNPMMNIATVVAGLSKAALDSGELKNNITKSLATLGSGVSGRFKEFGYQIWKGTDPLNIVLNASFYATWNAKVQVTEPTKFLQRLPLPATGKNGSNLIPPGPVVTDVIKSFQGDSDSSKSDYVFDIVIGDMYLKDFFIKEVTPTFSDDKMDVNGELLPMRVDVTISMVSMYTATKENIDVLWGSAQA